MGSDWLGWRWKGSKNLNFAAVQWLEYAGFQPLNQNKPKVKCFPTTTTLAPRPVTKERWAMGNIFSRKRHEWVSTTSRVHGTARGCFNSIMGQACGLWVKHEAKRQHRWSSILPQPSFLQMPWFSWVQRPGPALPMRIFGDQTRGQTIGRRFPLVSFQFTLATITIHVVSIVVFVFVIASKLFLLHYISRNPFQLRSLNPSTPTSAEGIFGLDLKDWPMFGCFKGPNSKPKLMFGVPPFWNKPQLAPCSRCTIGGSRAIRKASCIDVSNMHQQHWKGPAKTDNHHSHPLTLTHTHTGTHGHTHTHTLTP